MHAQAWFGTDFQRIGGIDTNHIFDFLFRAIGVSLRQIDFIQYRQYFEPLLHRCITSGHSLRFHTLRGIDH